jgi:FkbM family methyltransferase
VFLDVGAADPRDGSNTYYLERELGWSGIAVDAIGEYAGGYRQFRPRTRFVSAFVSDVSDAELEFHVLPGRPYSSSADRRFAEYWRNGQPLDSRRVRTVALNDLLRHMNVTKIDLLSMDIELHEPKALAGFDVARYRPQLACIEAHPSTRQWILDYFQRHGYRLLGRYLRLDAYNLWFAPM